MVAQILAVLRNLKGLSSKVVYYLVPSIKQVHQEKLKHIQAYMLAKCIFDQMIISLQNHDNILDLIPTLEVAESGIVELIEIIVEKYPSGLWKHRDGIYQSVLHVAIANRHEKVFNYIKGMGASRNLMTSYVDKISHDNALHLAAKLGPPHKLHSITGAALQMQRELQWFKEVEDIVQPRFKKSENSNGLTPQDLFTEEHKELVQKGEKWTKDMASSCMVVATLITTVVFAAAFTVPGGNISDKGTPIFLKNFPFMLFVFSDSLALFSSTTSVLIFLSILTSRFAEQDFLLSLPRKLLIGLTMLFVSILAMMAAFGATFFIMLGHHFLWVAILVSFLICLPVTLFAMLQFPLFLEIVQSTYGSKFFHQPSKSVLS